MIQDVAVDAQNAAATKLRAAVMTVFGTAAFRMPPSNAAAVTIGSNRQKALLTRANSPLPRAAHS
jgi:hypothetical protein